MSFIDDYVMIDENDDAGTQWFHYNVGYNGDFTDELLAEKVASLIVETRCPAGLFNKWTEAFEGILELEDIDKEELGVYLKPSIGSPNEPATENELQGAIAEYLWYEIVRSYQTDQTLVDIHKPSLRVTETGGDGLVVYQSDFDTYIFQLWEVKKHAQLSAATTKITRASRQLNSNGAEYLAKLSKVGQDRDHEFPGLSAFYAEIVRKWIESTEDARAGVSVSKDERSSISSNPVAIMRRELPTMTGEDQLSALIISVPNFANFCVQVREALWKDI